jgi:hypothetical protein
MGGHDRKSETVWRRNLTRSRVMISSTLHPPRPYQEFEPARTVPLDSGLATAQQIAFGAACLRGIMAPHLSLGGICRAAIRASMSLNCRREGRYAT